jgi:tRNA(Arg) A34 adenosine deaminase TadA
MLPDNKERYMLDAIKKAEENILTGKGGPFGAVVVRDGEIIATAGNCVTSTNDPTAHVPCAWVQLCGRGLINYTLLPTGLMLPAQALTMNYFILNLPYRLNNKC